MTEFLVPESPRPLDWDQLFAIAPIFTVSRDWNGLPLNGTVNWFLAVDPKSWYFGLISTCGSPVFDASFRNGEFREGLWFNDVAELFVLDCVTGAYSEWNLGPQGGWWAANFDSYRKRSTRQVLYSTAIRTYSCIDSTGWKAALGGPNETFPAVGKNQKLHFSAIVGSPEQRFLTSAPSPTGEPDFHKPSNFAPYGPLVLDK